MYDILVLNSKNWRKPWPFTQPIRMSAPIRRDWLDEITSNREIVIVDRRGKENVAMIAASELASLTETAHLLRSPANAKRLLTALHRARTDEEQPMTVQNLRTEVGIE